ncbi:Dimeric alpha+beta barrel [Glarea lozoyensis ATCC 20868]|uniref:Dimeric alpha+beta barrel n=1 Tax=Glarea lozoyensis (strain ATCC 20868 / MF5171) TaxID=1116229 RepID=S3CP97_GLAL2|nr:Dimeric alpha+beta barrel [Glarea lozoyensis ATCC 20868]EPE27535.1 Dimeric alpha+beta barrel [Glarea lozoyensis ATCC 20868]
MTNVSKNAYTNEPGVHKFALFTPLNDTNNNTLWTIEQYTNQSSFDAHFTTKPVQDMFAWINSADIYVSPPEVHSLNISAASDFARKQVLVEDNPWFVISQKTYQEGKRALGIEAWTGVVSEAKREEGMLVSMFGYGEGEGEGDGLIVLEGAAGRDYFEGVHWKSEAWRRMEEVEREVGKGSVSTEVKFAGGYLHK